MAVADVQLACAVPASLYAGPDFVCSLKSMMLPLNESTYDNMGMSVIHGFWTCQ